MGDGKRREEWGTLRGNTDKVILIHSRLSIFRGRGGAGFYGRQGRLSNP
jgi:hypothetical protein